MRGSGVVIFDLGEFDAGTYRGISYIMTFLTVDARMIHRDS